VRRAKGISIVELILAIVVLGVVATLAIPRFSGAAQAPDESALLRDRLQVLRVAIERYYQDHGAFPGQYGDGRAPRSTAEAFRSQLTQFTDEIGRVAESRDASHRFGPYLRDGVPVCPVAGDGHLGGVHVISGADLPAFTAEAPDAGWVYNCDTGQIGPNAAGTDSAGRSYAGY